MYRPYASVHSLFLVESELDVRYLRLRNNDERGRDTTRTCRSLYGQKIKSISWGSINKSFAIVRRSRFNQTYFLTTPLTYACHTYILHEIYESNDYPTTNSRRQTLHSSRGIRKLFFRVISRSFFPTYFRVFYNRA